MKILVLNGSPKCEKSNTLRLTDAFCEGVRGAAEAEVERLDLCRMDIKDCVGCFSCWDKTPGECCIKDDMAGVLAKMSEADVVIWSFPLYFFGLPARIKSVTDRQLPLFLPFMERSAQGGAHRRRVPQPDKRYVVISTCGFYTAEGNYAAVDAQMAKQYGEGGYTSIYCGQGELFREPALRERTDEYLVWVRRAGEEFARGGIAGGTRAKLSELLYPREVFEQMADAEWGAQSASDEPDDGSFGFTKQMAALYNTSSWSGKDIIIEFCYTDVGKTYQIQLKKDGHSVSADGFLPFTTRIETPLALWKRIGSGEISGSQAMAEHLCRVEGDFGTMLRWGELFGSGAKAEAPAEPRKKTKMSLMLLPWIVIWVLLAIKPALGGAVGAVVSAALPFAYLKWKATVFDCASILAVSAVCVAALLGASVRLLLPLSYLLFGIMWTATVFLPLPLTAYYSQNDYGGEKALRNALFIKTNRILTACWGVLYLLTPIWTYFLLGTDFGYLSGAFNSVLPLLLGVFTGWFQKWYPAHSAAKAKK